MARAGDLVLAPSELIGGGRIRTEERHGQTGKKDVHELKIVAFPNEKKISKKLEDISYVASTEYLTAVLITCAMHVSRGFHRIFAGWFINDRPKKKFSRLPLSQLAKWVASTPLFRWDR